MWSCRRREGHRAAAEVAGGSSKVAAATPGVGGPGLPVFVNPFRVEPDVAQGAEVAVALQALRAQALLLACGAVAGDDRAEVLVGGPARKAQEAGVVATRAGGLGTARPGVRGPGRGGGELSAG